MKEWNDVRHDVDKSLNLLTDCDQLCHVIHIIYLDRAKMERSAVPPYFLHHVEDAACDFGDVAKLQCDVTGQPEPTIAWFREGRVEPLSEFSGKYSVIQNCGHVILMIYDVTQEDIGRYTCKICNDLGETSSTGRLFFSPQYHNKSTNKEKHLKKLIIEETLKIVEKRDLPDVSSVLPNLGSHNNNTVAIAFAMPERCRTDVITVSTTQNGMDTKKNETESTTLSIKTQRLRNSSSVDDDTDKESTSDNDIISRLEWIEEGRRSESDFRKNSIPYPLSLDPEMSAHLEKTPQHSFEGDIITQRSLDCDSSLSESLMTWGDVTEKRSRVSRRRAALIRSYSSGSGSSGIAVGSGQIGRTVRAMSQNEYFDAFFDKRVDESDDDVIRDPLFKQPTLKEDAAEDDVIQSDDAYLNLNQSHPPNSKRHYEDLEYFNNSLRSNSELVTKGLEVKAEIDEVFEANCKPTNEEEVTSQLQSLQTSMKRPTEIKRLESKLPDDISDSFSHYSVSSENTSSLNDVNNLISALLTMGERPQVLISCLNICKNPLKNLIQSCNVSTFNVSFSQHHLVKVETLPKHTLDGYQENSVPEFLIPLKDVTTSNSGITLSIAVTGRPFPTVTWLHEGMLLDNGVLEATNQITASGKYSCVAINHNGKTSTSCDVMISYRSTSSSTGALLQIFQASLSFYEDS